MKKTLVVALMLIFAWGAFAEGTTVRAGRLTALPGEDALFTDNGGGARETVEFASLSRLLLALKDGGADYIALPRFAANYVAARNPGLTVIFQSAARVAYRMATAAENASLRDRLNAALFALREEGTLTALSNSWLGDAAADPVSIALPPAQGDAVIRAGVTGDLPPMDFIASDGTPAGFSVALMTLVAERAGLAVEFVPVASGERAAALSEGRIDVCFWVQTPDTPDASLDGGALCLTEAYFDCEIAYVAKNFSPERVREIENIR